MALHNLILLTSFCIVAVHAQSFVERKHQFNAEQRKENPTSNLNNARMNPLTQKVLAAVLEGLDRGDILRLSNTVLEGFNYSEAAWIQAPGDNAIPTERSRAMSLLGADLLNATATGVKAAFLGLQSSKISRLDKEKAKYSARPMYLRIESGQAGRAVPGITAMVYQNFFSKASGVAVQLLKENFKKVKLDTVTTIVHVPVVGDFQMVLEDVNLQGLSLDQTRTGVSLSEEGSLTLKVLGLNAIVNGHLQWRRTKFPFISGSCQARVTAEDGNVDLRVSVTDDGSGRPFITGIQAAQLSFSSISIVTSGAKLSWLYNAVAAIAKTQIRDAITREVAAQVTTTVPEQINNLLTGIPTAVEVKGLELNTSLAKAPQITAEKLTVWDWGRFQNPNKQLQDCPFLRQPTSDSGPLMPGGSPYMLIANLDESIANCLTWDMFQNNLLHKFLVGDEVPQQALYTDTWRFVIPQVYKKCPGCPMALNATVTSAPVTTFDATRGVASAGTADLSFFLADAGSTSQSRKLLASSRVSGNDTFGLGEHLFTLSLSGEIFMKDLRLQHDVPERPDGWRFFLSMKVNESALAVEVKESDVGKINKASLHLALTVAAFLVEDQINKGVLKDGFALPDVPHVTVPRANVTIGDAVLALGSDFEYAG